MSAVVQMHDGAFLLPANLTPNPSPEGEGSPRRRFEMKVPPFVYSLAFWKSVCYVLAALILWFKPDAMATDATLLVLVLAVLQLAGVVPELRSKGFKGFWK